MDKIIKAIPTTYKGISFRSKTEARFAVALDRMTGVYDWHYEQERIGDWLVDFTVWIEERLDVCLHIEIKPSEPTKEYIRWIASQTKGMTKAEGVAHVPLLLVIDPHKIYYIGDPLNDQETILCRFLACVFLDRYSAVHDLSLNYRFDLEKG
jgi:hydroxymethylpyrimidine pyrophosphatase-like HAD family hydrolase